MKISFFFILIKDKLWKNVNNGFNDIQDTVVLRHLQDDFQKSVGSEASPQNRPRQNQGLRLQRVRTRVRRQQLSQASRQAAARKASRIRLRLLPKEVWRATKPSASHQRRSREDQELPVQPVLEEVRTEARARQTR